VLKGEARSNQKVGTRLEEKKLKRFLRMHRKGKDGSSSELMHCAPEDEFVF